MNTHRAAIREGRITEFTYVVYDITLGKVMEYRLPQADTIVLAVKRI